MSSPRVVFLLSKFPCYDEAFLLREIHGVSQALDTWIFSLRRSRETVIHDEARDLLPRVLSAPRFLSAAVLRTNLALLFRRPRRFVSALVRLLAGSWKSPGFLLKNLFLFPKAVFLAHWAIENGVTHLHGGWATYPAATALAAAEIAGLPFSFSAHAHDLYLDATGLPEKLRRAAFVTTCTVSNRQQLRQLAPDCPESRVIVIRHGIRVESFASSEPRENPLAILSVGTLNTHKGFEQLIDALDLLAQQGADYRATIVGGGRLEPALRARLVTARLAGRVTLTGALTQDKLIPYFTRASIFVLLAQPEWHWGIANVIVEALAARNAVVTTRFGSIEELVRDGETGLLVPPKDPAAVAAALRRLAADPALRTRLGDAGHAVVAREFALDSCVSAYVSRFRGSAR